MISVDEFKVLLEDVRGVDRVVLHPKGSKEDQGNPGNPGSHYQQHNFFVYSKLFEAGVEFELTRDPHMKDVPGRPYTISAMFRDCGHEDLYLEAWRSTGADASAGTRADAPASGSANSSTVWLSKKQQYEKHNKGPFYFSRTP